MSDSSKRGAVEMLLRKWESVRFTGDSEWHVGALLAACDMASITLWDGVGGDAIEALLDSYAASFGAVCSLHDHEYDQLVSMVVRGLNRAKAVVDRDRAFMAAVDAVCSAVQS